MEDLKKVNDDLVKVYGRDLDSFRNEWGQAFDEVVKNADERELIYRVDQFVVDNDQYTSKRKANLRRGVL